MLAALNVRSIHPPRLARRPRTRHNAPPPPTTPFPTILSASAARRTHAPPHSLNTTAHHLSSAPQLNALSLNAPSGSRLGNPKASATLRGPKSKAGDFCYGLPGNIAPAGNFDPANLLEGTPKEEVYRWREAELTHGRVGMLASAGFLVQEFWHPLFSADGGPAIQQIPALPAPLWFAMTLGIGIAEANRIQKGWANPYEKMENVQALKSDYYPGDLDWDPLNLKPEDPAEFRLMQERELSHGRLAMLAAFGFMIQEAVTGTTWSSDDVIVENTLLGGWFAAGAAERAQDALASDMVPTLKSVAGF